MEETPITTNTLLKWGALGLTLLSALISLVWFAASTSSKAEQLSIRLNEVDRRIDANDKLSLARHEMQGRDIDRLRSHADDADKSIVDLSRKLDVAVAILERIEKRVAQGDK